MPPANAFNLVREQSYATPLQNCTLLPLLLMSLATQKHTPKTKSSFQDEYDYIVVGGGTAGSVVASRLSEIPSVKVLVLEAGPSPPLLTEVPVISRSFRNSDLDWRYYTEPQRHTAKLQINRQTSWPSGKAIGGSSITNSNLYIRGTHENYDAWEAQGANGWNSEEVFRYFIKAEDNRVPEFIKNGYHGVGGPMTVEMFGRSTELVPPLIRSQKILGYPFDDPNGPAQVGAANYQGNLRKGQRCSAAKAYLVPAEDRTNLDIIANVLVTKILTRNKKAIGVSFDYKGISYEVKARKEVILSAGTVNSAQLLMLSGIGPKNTLQKFGIPLVADLPVGENFHNHGGPVTFFTANSAIPTFSEKMQNLDNVRKYINTRQGFFAASETIFALTFLKTKPLDRSSSPDFQLYFCEAETQIVRGRLNVPEEVYNKIYAPYENRTNLYCNVHLLKPRSRGRVSIRSSNPYDAPMIDPNYFADPQDVKVAISGLKECFKILDSPELKRLGVRPFDTVMPGCESLLSNKDAYLECVTRSILIGSSHPVGTAKMGNPEDPSTVVDSNLRVKGVEGLRVVDASVVPIIPTGNTYAVVIMIAEKASDLIKKDMWPQWNSKKEFE